MWIADKFFTFLTFCNSAIRICQTSFGPLIVGATVILRGITIIILDRLIKLQSVLITQTNPILKIETIVRIKFINAQEIRYRQVPTDRNQTVMPCLVIGFYVVGVSCCCQFVDSTNIVKGHRRSLHFFGSCNVIQRLLLLIFLSETERKSPCDS